MKPLRWHSVIGGIAAIAVLTGITLFVILYARAGAVHGSQFRLFVAAPDASNLRKGSSVWLNGQRVGTVRAITFNQPTAPTATRLVIEMEVLNDVRPLIRIDSRADLRNGGTFIGEPVVYIQSGTRSARQIVPGDTLVAAGNPDMEIAASKVASSIEQLPVLIADSRTIIENAKLAGNRLSAIATTGAGKGLLGNSSLSNSASALLAKLTAGRGSTSRAIHDTALRSRVTQSMAGLDSVRQLLASRASEVGRFRRDSSLAPAVRSLQLDVARLREMSNSAGGGIGRARQDSALRHGLDSAFAELSALLADIKQHPFKYSRVF